MPAETAKSVTIRGPLRRADLPGLYARICLALGANAGGVLVCDVSEVASDAIAIDALCRLQLGARHHGCVVRLRNASAELMELAGFAGLDGVIREEDGALGVDVRR